jgi:hypothetical protein
LGNLWIEVVPIRIQLLNEPNFPCPIPSLETLFAEVCSRNVAVLFEIDQPMNVIFFREAICETHFMFVDPPHQVVGHTDVERAPNSAGENVYSVTTFHTHDDTPVFTGSGLAHDDMRHGGWHS